MTANAITTAAIPKKSTYRTLCPVTPCLSGILATTAGDLFGPASKWSPDSESSNCMHPSSADDRHRYANGHCPEIVPTPGKRWQPAQAGLSGPPYPEQQSCRRIVAERTRPTGPGRQSPRLPGAWPCSSVSDRSLLPSPRGSEMAHRRLGATVLIAELLTGAGARVASWFRPAFCLGFAGHYTIKPVPAVKIMVVIVRNA